jgi:hypothetical protein
MSNLYCDGGEIDLTDCSYEKGGKQFDRLAVKCEGMLCQQDGLSIVI